MKRLWPFFFLLLLIACDNEHLRPLKQIEDGLDFVNLQFQFCTTNPATKKSLLKFIFVIDKSTSNQNEGTDPTGERRYQAITNLLNHANDDPTITYKLINFSTNAEAVTPNFIEKTPFQTIINQERNLTNRADSTDQGWTNYLSALALVRTTIIDDVVANKALNTELVTTQYVVFFLSDGQPIASSGNLQAQNQIMTNVGAIMDLETAPAFEAWINDIQLHMGYYYLNADVDARALLQAMAQGQGDKPNGDFYEFSGGQIIDFSKFSLPERNVKFGLKDLVVTNLNTVWEGRELLHDSDGDGLSDKKELLLGSNPDRWDSDENGVGDGVEYAFTNKPCADVTCDATLADPYFNCSQFIRPEYVYQPGTDQQKFTDTDLDLLNNCEEQALLNSDPYHFDTNRDWVTDFHAFRSNGIISYNADPRISGSALDPDFDGAINYQEMKDNTPLTVDNATLADSLRPYRYTLTPMESPNTTQDCFQLQVEDLGVIGANNLLKIFILEKSTIIDTKRLLRVYELEANQRNLILDVRAEESGAE